MEEIVLEYLKQIRGLYTYYLAMLGLLVLGTIIHFQRKIFDFEAIKVEVFKFPVRVEYFSLIYGVLFGVFVLILFLEIRLLRSTFTSIDFKKDDDSRKLAEKVRYYPWITSPFQDAWFARFLFWSTFGVGYFQIGKLVKAHVWPKFTVQNKAAFQNIGYIDLAILIAALIFLGFIIMDVMTINKRLKEIESPTPLTPSST